MTPSPSVLCIPRLGGRAAFLAAGLLLAFGSRAEAAQRPLAAGDAVEVRVDAAAMKVREEVVAALKRGDRLVVERLWGEQLWTTVEVGGERRSGWVRVDQVRRIEPPEAAPIAEGDFVVVASLIAPVIRRGETIATLPRRYGFIAERVRDDAVATTVDIEGEAVQGWVSKVHLRRQDQDHDLPLGTGDTVVVTAETAPVAAGGKVIAPLSRGYVFTVEGARGDEVATTVDVAGTPSQGWVKASQVRRATPRDLQAFLSRWRTEEEPLCTIDLQAVLRETLAVSPDGWHVAYAERCPRGVRVVADGQPGPAFELIGHGTPLFGADGRLAYTALEKGRWRVSLGNLAGPPFERLAALTFSPDGRHVAYAALQDKQWRVLLDGRPGPPFDDVDRESLTFSPDGRRLAYAAKQWGKWSTVLDGKPGPAFDQVTGLLFSPRGERLSYVVRAGSQWRVLVDGEAGPPFDAIQERRFSGDGRRFAYVARSEGQFRVVVDGFVGSAYDGIVEGSPLFSPDGRRVAYAAFRGEKAHVVLDGKAQADVDGVAGPAFSPDSRLFACAVRKGALWHAVLDGEESLPYAAIARGTPVFSPDSRRIAFIARLAGRTMVVLDGQPGPAHDGVLTAAPLFSPDGKHIAYVVVSRETWRVVHDGRPGPPCDGIGAGTPLFSPDGGRVAYVGIRGGKWRVYVDGEAGAALDEVGEVVFSPDGRHLAYTARRGDDWRVVLDGEAGKPYGGLLKGSRLVFTEAGRLRYLAWRLREGKLLVWRAEHTPKR